MFQTSELRSRLPFKAIIPLLLISILCIVSFATSATISNGSTYKAIGGEIISITGNYEVTPIGLSIATEDTNLYSVWSTDTPLTTGVTTGNWIYTFTVTATQTANPATVSLSWSVNGDPYSLIDSITFLEQPIQGQTATFIFDTGTSSFESPVGILITVE